MTKPMGPREIQLRAMREANFSARTQKTPTAPRRVATPTALAAAIKAKEVHMAKKAKAKSKGKRTAKTKDKPTPTTGTDGDKAPREGTKLAIVVELLKRPEGCTGLEVLKATGWPSVSMPQMAKAAGLTLQKEKDGRVTRYRAAA